MSVARASRTISASPQELWELISDPHHLPRWWPRVDRVENVESGAFTEVLTASSGKALRADFQLLASDEQARSLKWAQRIDGTPFARVLKSAETEMRLRADQSEGTSSAGSTEVEIELRQTPRGMFSRLGGRMFRRAASSTLEEALDGLERIIG
jgi:uncharacterized protein YndB with AHSA1/START domain